MSDELDDLASAVSGSHAYAPQPAKVRPHKMGCLARMFLALFLIAVLLIAGFIALLYFHSRSDSTLLKLMGPSKALPHPVTPATGSYDKFKDMSNISVGPTDDLPDWTLLEASPDGDYHLPRDIEDGTFFELSYSFTGHTITSVHGIHMRFGGKGASDGSAIFLVDDRRFTTNSFWISPDDLLAVGKATSAEVQMGDKNYKFTPLQQQKILKFLDELGID